MTLTHIENTIIELIRAAFPLNENATPLPALEDTDWPLLVKTANQHGLGPLVFASLKESGLLNVVPKNEIETLRLAYVRASVANRQAFQDLSFFIDRFEREKIPLIILKGGALGVTIYPDIALRPMGDLDLLIAPNTVERATRALIEQGYVAYAEMSQGFANRFSVEQGFLRKGNRPSQIDLHWHAFTTPYYFERIPVEWFWQRTMEISINHRRAFAFSPTAQLLHLSAHYMMHSYRRLIWSYDLALLVARCYEQIDWEDVIESAEEFGLSQVLYEALSEVRKRWGIAIPVDSYERLRTIQMPWRGRMVFAATNKLSDAELDALKGLGLRGTLRKSAYWLRVMFPSRGYMETRYQINNKGLMPLYYLRRAGKAAHLIARAGFFVTRRTILSSRASG
ncbi:MAG TPA: nucleotidyltransferase family protein [Blastocatellia bacterium]|nr:nucleotidyltransferase family protein [Blastocatellia bacterium]